MPNQPRPDATAPDMLRAVGRALYGEDEQRWQAELTMELGIRGKSIRQWLSGHLHLRPDHGLWDTLLALLEKRETAIREAREKLQAWMRRNRTPGDGA